MISSSKNLVEDHFKTLLSTIIEISSTLNKRQRILILEDFAGRTLSQKDGGIYLIQSKANLNELLKIAVNTLSNFTCTMSDNTSEVGWENIQHNSPQNTDTNNTICNSRRNVYMKATGIVRRIEARVIIGQTA